MASKGSCNSMAPLMIRLILGLTFIWAGLGKVMENFPVQGEQAAKLANMGVYLDKKKAAPATPEAKPDTPKQTSSLGGTSLPALASTLALAQASGASGSAPQERYSAGEFPDPIPVPRVYALALMFESMGAPANGPDGKPLMALWPATLSKGFWPLALAWAVTIVEIGAGTLVLVGLVTRLAGLALACIMLGAMWTTEIGPALQSGKTLLGFLPQRPTFDQAWQTFLIQFLLLGSALSVMFSGCGALGFDKALFGSSPGRPADKSEDKPKA